MKSRMSTKPLSQKKEFLFRDAPIWNAVFSMALPTIFSMLVMVFYNMADMFFIGQMGDSAQVAAVSLTGPVFNILMAIGSMLGGGSCALIAQTLGSRDGELVKLYSSLTCWGSLLFGGLFSAVLLFGCTPILGFLGANGEIWPSAKIYLSVLAWGAPVMVFTTSFGNLIRAEGAVKDSMFCHLLSTAVNLVLDPLFILVFRMGVGGAAIATVLGNMAGAVYLLHYVFCRSDHLTLSPFPSFRHPASMLKILAIGLPNFISSTLVGLSHAFANQLLVGYGTIVLAGRAAAGKATTLVSTIQMGIPIGVQPLLAYNYGAQNLSRIREALRKLTFLTIAVGCSLALVCCLYGKTIVSWFLKELEALTIGQKMVELLVLTGPFLGIYYIASSFLQAIGQAKAASLVSLLRQGIFLVPLLYIMDRLLGQTGNIWATIIADIAAAAVAVVAAFWQYRVIKREFTG